MRPAVVRVTLCLVLFAGSLPLAAQEGAGARALRAVAGPSEMARWLVAYDRIAWVTSDSVMTAPVEMQMKLGPEWFCDTLRGTWHAIYGRYDAVADTYSIYFHYAADSAGRMRSTRSPVDSTRMLAMARALHTTKTRLPPTLAPQGLSLNKYVRRLGAERIEVTYLPAAQPNGLLVIGGEISFVLDGTGRAVLDSTYHYSGYRALRPDTSLAVTIPAEDIDYPTVGQLFFMLNFRQSFRQVNVRTKRIFGSFAPVGTGVEFMVAVRDSVP